MTIETTSSRLKRATELGHRLRAIRGEAGLWSLSCSAWSRLCLELSGWSEPGDLLAADHRVTGLPCLNREVDIRARLWADSLQDRPAVYAGFLDADRFPGCYSELLASCLTVEQVSAVAAYRCAIIRAGRGHPWGTADSVDPVDGDAALAMRPHLETLAELDVALSTTVRLVDITWRAGRPWIEAGDVAVELTQDSANRLASAFAEAAALRVERAEAA